MGTRIVQFAKQHGATILVFEHLGKLKPQKGKYSRRGNSKRAFWMKGHIFRYAKYKAWNEGIVTSRVNPRNTSRECARCSKEVSRYEAGHPAEGYTPGAPLVLCQACDMHVHRMPNASVETCRDNFLVFKYLDRRSSVAIFFEREKVDEEAKRDQHISSQ